MSKEQVAIYCRRVRAAATYPRESRREAEHEAPRMETGPDRWARWAAMVEGRMSEAKVARAEGVSRAAVMMGLRKFSVP